jgi:hypothetical protein
MRTLGTIKTDISIKQINQEDVKDEILYQAQLGIDGFVDSVPTVFVGGVLVNDENVIKKMIGVEDGN